MKLTESNTMHQRTYILITSLESVELSLAQFDYIHCAESVKTTPNGFEYWLPIIFSTQPEFYPLSQIGQLKRLIRRLMPFKYPHGIAFGK